ncbi:MAG: hypothetical protein Kow0068_23500 [Marinilabiliales bacterium]
MEIIIGNAGKGVRSDCQIKFINKNSGGRKIEINSKVSALFGDDINELCVKMLDYYDIKHCELYLEDSGALDFVISARIEAAIRKATGSEKEYLPDMISENIYDIKPDNFRFSRLYLPGNNPKMMINAGIHKPSGIILDLEDSVAPDKKYEARFLVRNALRKIDFYGAERMVRINQGEMGVEDLSFIIPHHVHTLLIPKCENPEYIQMLDEEIDKLRQKHSVNQPVYYMPIIESALGIENAYNIAKASGNVVAMAIGLEDFTADLGVQRTKEATESFYARTRLVNACKAAGIQAIDSVFSDVADSEGLLENVKISKSLGFEGMGCIHPRQIPIIHQGYAPETNEIEKAKKIVLAFEEANAKGLGVVSLGSKMIDPPVVKRAQRTIELAVKLGLISNEWRNNNE